ncbi:glycosyltransferase [Candidatus Magnetomonas plexicatena]|uniref:glycosyltransferase n=1 Tax=Candidatus Magnetomonas plexicatena TaxID=2552947 RepID=UPI001C77BEA1|nr:glycosyltransferase [Nitrospirales bacterium LBB_01]
MIKRVVMVARPFYAVPPLKGAAVEMWMCEVSKRLLSFEPHIISISAPYYPDYEYRDGIYHHRVRFGGLYKHLFQKLTRLDPFSYAKRVLKIIREVNPQIVHLHNSVKLFLPLLKSLYGTKIKTVLHLQNEHPVDAALSTDALWTCSRYLLNYFDGSLINAGSRTCIYNGVDLDKFRYFKDVPGEREEVRRRFNIKNDDFVVLFIGRVSPEKGVEHIIETAGLLRDKKNVKFFIIGELQEGDLCSDRVRYGVEMMRRAEVLDGKVVFTGMFPPQKMHHFHLLGDVLVLPSNFEEPFGFVVIEAMATGLPVIVRKKGGVPEYIKDNENGLFIDEADKAGSISGIIRTLIKDTALRESIGMSGRKTVEERFSWQRIARDCEDGYQRLMDEK